MWCAYRQTDTISNINLFYAFCVVKLEKEHSCQRNCRHNNRLFKCGSSSTGKKFKLPFNYRAQLAPDLKIACTVTIQDHSIGGGWTDEQRRNLRMVHFIRKVRSHFFSGSTISVSSGRHRSYQYLSSWKEFVKRVAISHKRNVITGGYVPKRPKKTNRNGHQQFCCLECRMHATETCYIIKYATKIQKKNVNRSVSCNLHRERKKWLV
jgi:hypothetical protein